MTMRWSYIGELGALDWAAAISRNHQGRRSIDPLRPHSEFGGLLLILARAIGA